MNKFKGDITPCSHSIGRYTLFQCTNKSNPQTAFGFFEFLTLVLKRPGGKKLFCLNWYYRGLSSGVGNNSRLHTMLRQPLFVHDHA